VISLRRVIGNNVTLALLNLPILPSGVRAALARTLEVRPDANIEPMSEADAALHAPAGTPCSACGTPFRPADPVRASSRGTVHDVCPA
jgi:hypothetical protein